MSSPSNWVLRRLPGVLEQIYNMRLPGFGFGILVRLTKPVRVELSFSTQTSMPLAVGWPCSRLVRLL